MEITVITVKDRQLKIIYSKVEEGLYRSFSSDDKLAEYIFKNPEVAFCEAITVNEDGIYLLNIASTENLGAFEWEQMPELLDRQLKTFTPIVNNFIKYVLTNQL